MSSRTMTTWRLTTARSSWGRINLWALVCLGWIVCSVAWAGTLQGTATYSKPFSLPADAVFEAELQDISRAGAPATVLGRSQLDPAGQPPFRFEIAHDDAALQAGRRYSVRATIKHQGRLLFTTDRIHPVLDGRIAPLEIRLVPARGGPPPRSMADGIGLLPASYEEELPGAGNPIAWRLDLLPEGRYRLRLTYVGRPEPNRFDGQRLPVAMEGDYKALEAVYLEANPQPGQPLLASLEGLITQRPSMEPGRPPRTTLVVERFIAVWPRASCGGRI